MVYNQLYPHIKVKYMSPFSKKCGSITLGGDVFGSASASWGKCQSFLCNYGILASKWQWPIWYWLLEKASGYCTVLLQAFCGITEQTIVYQLLSQSKSLHVNTGTSATVRLNTFEPLCMCNFIPVERTNVLLTNVHIVLLISVSMVPNKRSLLPFLYLLNSVCNLFICMQAV